MSVARRADGRWIVRYKDRDGAWRQKAFRDEQTARAFEASWIESSSMSAMEERLTLGELVILYYRGTPDAHPRTKRQMINLFAGWEKDGVHVDGACEFLRDKYAESLNRNDLERLREVHRRMGTGNNTINKYQAYIRAILAWGVEQDLIRFNPWRDFRRLKVKKVIIKARMEDLRRLYPELPAYLQWAVKTAFFLAPRPGQAELFSLRWDAFNFRSGRVAIRQGKSGQLKTVIPHPDYMSEARARYESDMAAGIPLVCHRDGARVLSFPTAWENSCRRAGVQMRPYDIRHIAATEMLARGADLAAVAAWA